MKLSRPYISIDIETTGLNKERSDILEIGYVVETFEGPTSELSKGSILIKKDHYDYSEPFAMQMNAQILKEISKKDSVAITPAEAFDFLNVLVKGIGTYCYAWDMKNRPDPSWATSKVCIAGKNAVGFDIPILRNFFSREVGVTRQEDIDYFFSKVVHHRVMDVGSMYFKQFNGEVPSLSDINKLTGRNEVTHRAVDDAMDVAVAIRHLLEIPV